jgi:hypothetical protein
MQQDATIKQDTAMQDYFASLKTRRDNDGNVSPNTARAAVQAVRQFLTYTDLEITDHTLTDLIRAKKNNPHSSDIETTLRAFASEQPIKPHAILGALILGIFKANFAPLSLRISTHFPPAAENCTPGLFREIFSKLTDEQRAMIQWGLFNPERATAAYRTPLNDIDLSRTDYAVIKVRAHSTDYNNKSKVEHPAFIPMWFAKPIIEQARKQGRRYPFPDHQQEWKKVTAFAKQEYGVRLVSNYTRKYFEYVAAESTLKPAYAAFLMGDKTKLAQTGHLPQFYNIGLRFQEELIRAYKESGIENLLIIPAAHPRLPHGGQTAQAVFPH